jgi:lipopolysaccharide/colanic/teichoic acid biosynthesis glycosyltransferase
MIDDDIDNYQSLLETSYFPSYPVEDDSTWYDNLSTGAKVGFIIGMCGAGLLVIAGVALLVILLINKHKKKMPVYKKKRIKVDTTDDKDIDVYADESAKPADETVAPETVENNSDTNE